MLLDELNKKLEWFLLKMKHLRTENHKIRTENTELANEILERKTKTKCI